MRIILSPHHLQNQTLWWTPTLALSFWIEALIHGIGLNKPVLKSGTIQSATMEFLATQKSERLFISSTIFLWTEKEQRPKRSHRDYLLVFFFHSHISPFYSTNRCLSRGYIQKRLHWTLITSEIFTFKSRTSHELIFSLV